MNEHQMKYLQARINDKKHQIQLAKQRVSKFEAELEQLKRQRWTLKPFREKLAIAFGK